MLRKAAMALLVATAVAGAIYYECVLDARVPKRPDLKIASAFGANIWMSYRPTPINEEMQKKYGDDAIVTFRKKDFKVQVMVDDKLEREFEPPTEVHDIVGFVGITERGAATSKFPFNIGFEPEPIRVANLSNAIQDWVSKSGQSDAIFSFSDKQWSRDTCQLLSPGKQFPGASHVFGSGSFCVVRWEGARPTSMLVSVTRGAPWLRSFSKRVCRFTLEEALAQTKSTGRATPDYATCILVDRPQKRSAQEALVYHSYAVDPSQRLALIK